MHLYVRLNDIRNWALQKSYYTSQFQTKSIIRTTNKSVLCNLFCVMKLCVVVTVIHICVFHVMSRGLLCIFIHYVIRIIIAYGNMLYKKVVFRNEELLYVVKLYKAVTVVSLRVCFNGVRCLPLQKHCCSVAACSHRMPCRQIYLDN